MHQHPQSKHVPRYGKVHGTPELPFVLYDVDVRFRRTFLPAGYPSSVRKEYMEYQTWDTVQVQHYYDNVV